VSKAAITGATAAAVAVAVVVAVGGEADVELAVRGCFPECEPDPELTGAEFLALPILCAAPPLCGGCEVG